MRRERQNCRLALGLGVAQVAVRADVGAGLDGVEQALAGFVGAHRWHASRL